MDIGGYQRLTLIDYPGHLATTVFTVGCNFRCPFCHNPEIIALRPVSSATQEKEFFKFLRKRRNKLDGVCITGGEPTLQPDLLEFMAKIKKMGFLVKLDSNGSRPEIIKKALDLKLVDYLAMDIKNQPERYAETIGLNKIDLEKIKLSVELLRKSGLSYEFRTTVVPGIHTPKDFLVIGDWLKGARAYYLQAYREEKILDENLKKKTKGQTIDLEKIKESLKGYFSLIELRG